ncbi:uncharacterized protein LOC127751366 [Frankliniella occidentalis]|uniref:Uncharacterized protein LOC127750671 n=1 Tax=Frankliniella occidentalis TaxID=133901 RepID=A0A9C6X807_FRAOC|nr:uncharacterized protein LOC127750671 [Frankliniella occidentalis]XP_052130793.1 uncharacterized protein LOC127751366 [Frankliniella occidentalis]
MKKTLYLFKKHFSHLKAPVKFHYFCSDCSIVLKDSTDKCPNQKKHKNKTQVSYFLEIPLEHQIRTLFKRKGFADNILSRLTRKKEHPNNIEDIYDGQLYKELVDSGFFSENKYNFTLTWNSDGVPVFNSSKTSMWPIYFVINELPFKLRFKKSNVLLGGIWYGSKPIYSKMLEPFLSSLSTLRRGLDIQLNEPNEEVTVQGVLLAGTADLPAKADFMGIKHSGGSCSCTVCKIEGKSVKANQEIQTKSVVLEDGDSTESENETSEKNKPKKSKKTGTSVKQKRVGSVWVFPYSNSLDLRRHEETETAGEQALDLRSKARDPDRDKVHVLGVKWPTYLSKIMPDMIRGMGIDDLHHSYHGVGHKLLELWTLPKYKSMPWSISSRIDLIDDRMQKVCLPNFVQCGVRTLSNLSLWKGQHMKIFLLYLALPVLEGILPVQYYNHFATFIHCLYVLNSSSISPEDLIFCSKELDTFVRQFQELYGERHMTINIHNTLHLCFVVNNLGPMRCFSCFPFESLNGEMLKMIHGTKYVQIQLANCAYLVLSFPNEISNLECPLVQDFAKNLHHSHQKVKLLECVSPNVYAAGNYIDLKNVHVDVINSLRLAGKDPPSCIFFNKLKIGSNLFVAQTYKRATKTASYLVSYNSNSSKRYAIILYFVKSPGTPSLNVSFQAAIQSINVRGFSTDRYLKKIKHISRYTISQEITFIDVHLLKNICFSVQVEGKDCFICERNNWLEIE